MFLQNTLEGGTDEVTISAANSGGASGNAFTAVNGSGPHVFDTAQASHGTLSARMSTGSGGANRTSSVSWSFAAVSTLYGRFYYRRASSDTTDRDVIKVTDGSTQSMTISKHTSNVLDIHDRTGTSVATGTTALSANTWYRIEFSLDPGSSGSATVYLFSGDSATPLETIGPVTADFNGETAANFIFGQDTSLSDLPAVWFDSLAVSDTALIGAYERTVAATGVASTSAIGSPATSYEVTATGVASTSAIGLHTLVFDQFIDATGVASTAAIGSPTVATEIIVVPGLASTAAIGSPSLLYEVSSTGVASTASIGTPTITAVNEIQADDVQSFNMLGSHAVSTFNEIATTGIASTAATGTPGVATVVSATGVASTAAIGLHLVESFSTQTVTGTGVPSTAAVGLPLVAFELPVPGTASTAAVGTPGLQALNVVSAIGTDGFFMPAVVNATVYRPVRIKRPRTGVILYGPGPSN